MSVCEYGKPLIGAAIVFLIYTVLMAVGIVMMPGNTSEHFVKNQNELSEAWRKARSRNWQAPIFAVTFPLVFLGVLPMAFPLVAVVTGLSVALFGWWLQC